MAKIMRFLLLFLLKCPRGGIFCVKKLLSGVGKQKKRSGAPWGPMREAANGKKTVKMRKIQAISITFISKKIICQIICANIVNLCSRTRWKSKWRLRTPWWAHLRGPKDPKWSKMKKILTILLFLFYRLFDKARLLLFGWINDWMICLFINSFIHSFIHTRYVIWSICKLIHWLATAAHAL